MDLPTASDVQRFAELSPAGYLSPAVSAAFVYGFVPGILVAAIALALVRAVEQRLRIRSLAGPGVAVVEGEVEDADGAPVEVTIVQSGQQAQGAHHWREIRRSTAARPFELRVAGGVLRVEPGDRPTLMIPLDEADRRFSVRTLRAALDPGARAYIIGEPTDDPDAHVELAYRGASIAPVLRAPPGRRMVIATEPPGGIFRARGWFHLRWALALLAVFPLNQLWFRGYIDRSAHGEVVWGTVRDRRVWTSETHDAHGTHHETHRAITVFTSAGRGLTEEVGSADYAQIAEWDRVPFLEAGADIHLGESPSARAVVVFCAMITSLIPALLYLGRTRVTRPWYEKARVNHSGSGSLSGSPPLMNALV